MADLPPTSPSVFGPDPRAIAAAIEQLDILAASITDEHLREHAEIARRSLEAASPATGEGLDVERLATAIHNSTARGTDHTGPTCRYCREEVEEWAAEYARLTEEAK